MLTDKKIIEEDMVNAKDFCPYYSCEVDCYEARMCQWFVDTLQQLKRKEQECEEWKHQAELGCETTDRLTKELEEKKQEYEHLREAMHKNRCTHYVLGECSQEHHNNCVGKNQCIKDLEQECEILKKKLDIALRNNINITHLKLDKVDLQSELDQLKQALKEIKEVAKECEKTKNCSNCFFFTECDDNGYSLIIKKINEVTNE